MVTGINRTAQRRCRTRRECHITKFDRRKSVNRAAVCRTVLRKGARFHGYMVTGINRTAQRRCRTRRECHITKFDRRKSVNRAAVCRTVLRKGARFHGYMVTGINRAALFGDVLHKGCRSHCNPIAGVNRAAQRVRGISFKYHIVQLNSQSRVNRAAVAVSAVGTEESSRDAERSADIDRAAQTSRSVVFKRAVGDGQISRGIDRAALVSGRIGQELIRNQRQVVGFRINRGARLTRLAIGENETVQRDIARTAFNGQNTVEKIRAVNRKRGGSVNVQEVRGVDVDM